MKSEDDSACVRYVKGTTAFKSLANGKLTVVDDSAKCLFFDSSVTLCLQYNKSVVYHSVDAANLNTGQAKKYLFFDKDEKPTVITRNYLTNIEVLTGYDLYSFVIFADAAAKTAETITQVVCPLGKTRNNTKDPAAASPDD